jgi:hypothetical protein
MRFSRRWVVLSGCATLACVHRAAMESEGAVEASVEGRATAFAGVVRGTMGRVLVIAAPDVPGHRVGVTESTGTHESTGAEAFFPGAAVRTVETWDFQRAGGADRGFLLVAAGADTVVLSYDGRSTRRADDSGSELVGTMQFVRGTGRYTGVTGTAAYTGLAAGDGYELRWTGTYRLPEQRARQ